MSALVIGPALAAAAYLLHAVAIRCAACLAITPAEGVPVISGISIAGLLILLVLGAPMVAALLFAVTFNFVMAGQWPMMVPQTMISGVSQFTLIALPLFVLSGHDHERGRHLRSALRLRPRAGGLDARRAGAGEHPDLDLLRRHDRLVHRRPGGVGLHPHPGDEEGGLLVRGLGRRVGLVLGGGSADPAVLADDPLFGGHRNLARGAVSRRADPGPDPRGAFMLLVSFLSRRHGWARHGQFSMAEVWRSGRRSFLAFGVPVIIVGGLVSGVFTPSEGGAFAVVYALVLSMFVYRS
jgi:hypothetical protein